MSGAGRLSDLLAQMDGCTKCPLSRSRTNVVPGDGSDSADLMFVGEAPGRAEDEQGLPFVGPAGKLLDQLLSEIGLSRSDVYITNVVKCRPPGNRDPLPSETETCNPFLEEQISIIRPRIICALGRVAASVMSGRGVQMTRMHGQRLPMPGFFLVPVFHPAAALRTPSTMALIREDFQRLAAYLDSSDRPPEPRAPQPEQMGLF